MYCKTRKQYVTQQFTEVKLKNVTQYFLNFILSISLYIVYFTLVNVLYYKIKYFKLLQYFYLQFYTYIYLYQLIVKGVVKILSFYDLDYYFY